MKKANVPMSRGRIAPAIGLFLLAPLVAEFLLGNLPAKLLPALIVLGPLYGGGALLIRETARRSGRGWTTMFVLGLAYAIVEEAFATQSLFNPDYLRLKLHLLDAGYLSVFGIGSWWTLLMLNLHAVWSVSVPIAFVEAVVPERASMPWLGRLGYVVTCLVFVTGVVLMAGITLKQDPFVASRMQLGCAAIVAVLLIALAFRLRIWRANRRGWIPGPLLVGAFALVAGSAVQMVPKGWGWGAAVSLLLFDVVALGAVLSWSRRIGWNRSHTLALAAGAAMAYAWHSFVQVPVIGGSGVATRVGNVVFTVGAVWLIYWSAQRTSAFESRSPTRTGDLELRSQPVNSSS